MTRAQQATQKRQQFLARLADMQAHVPMTEEEFYLWENGDEEHVIPLIKKYLRTPWQASALFAMDKTIEDCLNGRIEGEANHKEVFAMFEDWNAKLGKKHFSY